MRQYKATYNITFTEHNFNLATRANLMILRILKSTLKEFDVSVECKNLKEVK